MPTQRIAAFVRGESEESFGELALALFRAQYARGGPLRELCDLRGVTPETLAGWREVPVLPAAALEDPQPAAAPADAAGLDLQRAAIDRSFSTACLTGLDRPPVLSLVATGEEASDPGLSRLADGVLETWAAPDSVVAVARRGVETAKARGFLAARQRDRRPVLILATTTSLEELVEALERRKLRFRLPPGSRVVAARGAADVDHGLLQRLDEALAVPAEAVISAFGSGPLTTHLYARRDRRGGLQPFRPPPWVRARVLDATGAELPAGGAGALAVFDLAGPAAAAHLLTGDLAVAAEDGFRLSGGLTG